MILIKQLALLILLLATIFFDTGWSHTEDAGQDSGHTGNGDQGRIQNGDKQELNISSTEGPAPEPPPNQMPSFEEWKRQVVEKELIKPIPLSTSVITDHNSNHLLLEDVQHHHSSSSHDLKLAPNSESTESSNRNAIGRNYASNECGAKVLSSTEGSVGSSKILNEMMDEYMLNPCKNHIWVVIELCEPIQITHLQLANLELYSSTPKEFTVAASESFPTREWQSLGTFTASPLRAIQSFSVENPSAHGFRKYIKLELLSRYGDEHYCPLSIVRAYGTTMVDEYEAIESGSETSSPPTPVVDVLLSRDTVESESKSFSRSTLNTTLCYARDIILRSMGRLSNFIKEKDHSKEQEPPVETENVYTPAIISQVSEWLKNLGPYLDKCGTCGTKNNIQTLHVSNVSSLRLKTNFCRFLNALLGDDIFSVLCFEHMRLSNSSLAFQCDADSLDFKPMSAELRDLKPSKPLQINKQTITDNHTYLDSSANVPQVILEASQNLSNASFPTNTNETSSTSTSIQNSTTVDLVATRNLETEVSLPASSQNESIVEIVDSNATNANTLDTPSSGTHEQPLVDNTEILKSPITRQSNVIAPSHFSAVPIPGTQTKESVFMRLNNRIKALEVNMSLSSQYLEELSQRYRRQVDEMQRSFEKTIARLNETERSNTERDLKQVEAITILEEKISQLMEKFNQLEFDHATFNFRMLSIHLALIIFQIGIITIFTTLCTRRALADVTARHLSRLERIEEVRTATTRQAASSLVLSRSSDIHFLQDNIPKRKNSSAILEQETPSSQSARKLVHLASPLKRYSSSPAVFELCDDLNSNLRDGLKEENDENRPPSVNADQSRTSSTSSGISSTAPAQEPRRSLSTKTTKTRDSIRGHSLSTLLLGNTSSSSHKKSSSSSNSPGPISAGFKRLFKKDKKL